MQDVEFHRVALIGGVYSNYLALEQALTMVEGTVDTVFLLGDLGAFGPFPDRTIEMVRNRAIPVIQGNYEEALSSGAADCHCGYTDPRDNHFARLSYDYTFRHTAAEHREWMGTLPHHRTLQLGKHRVLLCHGSPRRINEFLWESTTPTAFIRRLLQECDVDLIACTHTGLHWQRWVAPGRGIVNVGAIGRPANDGETCVWLAVLEEQQGDLRAEFLPVRYDHQRLASEMMAEGLPPEFATTILTGWWTTCLEILPARERERSRW